MSEDGLVAERVDEGGSACCETALSASETHDAIRGKGVLSGVADIPVPEAPHTMRQNWMPFFTFFFFRVIFWRRN